MSSARKRIGILLAGLAFGVALGGRASADDTEIFFPSATITDTGANRQNLVLMIDTSGSMSDFDGGNESRMLRVQKAAKALVASIDSVFNVGLMRLSGAEGGAVLFPAKPIDSYVSDYVASGSSLSAADTSGGGTDEAAQDPTGAVTTGPGALLVRKVSAAPPTTVTSRIAAIGDEAEEHIDPSGSGKINGYTDTVGGNGTRTSSDINLNYDAGSATYCNDPPGTSGCVTQSPHHQWVGLRFQPSVPAGVTLTHAYLQFTCMQADSASAAVTIYGESSSNPNQYVRTNLRSNGSLQNSASGVSGRTQTSTSLGWTLPACTASGTVIQSVDLISIVNQLISVGWKSGNYMAFDLTSSDTSGGATGTRKVYSRSGLSAGDSKLPTLVLQYATATVVGDDAFGVRFRDIRVPTGVHLTSATVTFHSDANLGSSPFSADVLVENTSSPAAYAATANNVSGRSYVTAASSWSIPATTVSNQTVATPDLSTAITSLIGSAGWCGGDDIAIYVKPNAATADASRSFYSYLAKSASAPVLTLTYAANDPALDTGCARRETQRQINTSDSDAEEQVTSSHTVSINGDDLELGVDTNSQVVAVRFTNLPIPKSATIRAAYIEFTAKGSSSSGGTLTIRGEAVDNAPGYTSSASSITTRKTAASVGSVSWSPPGWTSAVAYDTPDLTAIVQAIVNRTGWASGNAMSFFIDGSGTHRAYSADGVAGTGNAAYAPLLVVQYESTGGRLTVRDYLKQLIDDLQTGGSTPLPEVMYEAARYFRGEAAWYGMTRGSGGVYSATTADEHNRISTPLAFTTAPTVTRDPACDPSLDPNDPSCASERITTSSPTYQSPIESGECKYNTFVMLTDGDPNSNEVETRAESMMGSNYSCASHTNSGETCGREIARFLSHEDQASSLTGKQIVKTHTIGFGADIANSAAAQTFLSDIAAEGLGQNFSASDTAGTLAAFRAITSTINAIPTTFVAPAVTVNTFNRLTHRNEIYFALFKPALEPRWEGNLKRYALGGSNPVRIQDMNSSDAVDSTTGFFKTTAKSFWAASGDPADGDQVSSGGMVSKFTTSRHAYTYTGSDPTSASPLDLTAAAQALDKTNSAITKDLLGDASMSDTDRNNILDFAKGIDVADQDNDNNRTEARAFMGDPLHSEPVLVTYGGTSSSPTISVFMGTNEGGIHGVDASNGNEQFVFIPKDLLQNQKAFYNNGGSYNSRPYGVDGPLTTWVNDANGNFSLADTGDFAYLYAGMRMGGRNYYGLDVTTPTAPKLRFVIRGGSGSFYELGQTWSRATVGKIKLNGVDKNVLIFSGGYDVSEDDTSRAVAAADGMGRALFIADASTGALLWWGGIDPGGATHPDLTVSQMRYSTPASPKAIDLDADGYVDRIYLVDVAGQLFKFTINQANTGAANFATARRIAVLGGASIAGSTAANQRRFYTSPDAAIIRDGVTTPFVAVSLGSGHRGHPLNTSTLDRFYVIRDPDTQAGQDSNFLATDQPNLPNSGDSATLFDATSNAIASSDATTAANAKTALGNSKGFYVDLTTAGVMKGEKVITESKTFANQVLFATYEPNGRVGGTACQAPQGLSRFYLFSVVDATPTYNLDTSDNSLTTSDRSKSLAQGGLPPDPTILFPEINGTLPQQALVCIGPECMSPNFTISTTKTYWKKRK